MINKEEMLEIFKDSFPKTTVELLGSAIYPDEIPQQVKVMPLSLQDEKRILTQDNKTLYDAVLEIVKQGLAVPLDIEKLYLFDIDYLFNIIRIQTHGAKVGIDQKCEKCNTVNHISFDLSEADINKPSSVQEIQSMLKIRNIDILFELPTVQTNNKIISYINDPDYILELKDLAKKNEILSPDSIDLNTLMDLATIFSHMKKFNNEDIQSKEDYQLIMLFVLTLRTEELLQIRNQIINIKKVFDIHHEYECKKCGNKIKLSLMDLGSDYFFPSQLS